MASWGYWLHSYGSRDHHRHNFYHNFVFQNCFILQQCYVFHLSDACIIDQTNIFKMAVYLKFFHRIEFDTI